MPQFFSSFQEPSYTQSNRSAVTYDYTGLDDQIKRQDELGQMRDAKTSALMSGDLDTAMKAGGRIRDLLAYTRVNAPGTTERKPMQIVNPLVRIASRSNESSYGSYGGQAEWFKPDGGGPAGDGAGRAAAQVGGANQINAGDIRGRLNRFPGGQERGLQLGIA